MNISPSTREDGASGSFTGDSTPTICDHGCIHAICSTGTRQKDQETEDRRKVERCVVIGVIVNSRRSQFNPEFQAQMALENLRIERSMAELAQVADVPRARITT